MIARVWIGAAIKQVLDDFNMAFFGRAKQRCLTAQVHAERRFARRRQLDVGTAFAQIAHTFEEALLGC